MMDRYLPAALIGACGVSATALFGRLLRPRFPIRVNCWFCDKNSIVPYGNRNCWDCPLCDQYNGFDEDGNYNKAIPAQFSESLNSLKGCSSAQQQLLLQEEQQQQQHRGSNFCADCNRNQLMKIKQLAAFVPVQEEDFDEEVDLFKKRLDVSLALCGSCQAKAESVIDQQNRSLMYNIAEDAILKTKQRRSDVDIAPTASVDISSERRRLYRRSAKLLNVLLVGVGFLLAASLYSRHFDQIRARWPSAPELPLRSIPHRLKRVHSLVDTHPLIFIFSGVFLSLFSVSLKNEARADAGYSDLIVVMAWLSWLVVRLVLDHALYLPLQTPSSGRTTTTRTSWISSRLEHLVYPFVVVFAVAFSLLNCLVGIIQKSKSWRSPRKLTTTTTTTTSLMAGKQGSNSVFNSTTSPLHPFAPRYVNTAYAQTTTSGDKEPLSNVSSSSHPKPIATPPITDPLNHSPPPTSTPPPPPTSRPPSPRGSIVGQGIELRMGDIAGMTLSTGLTPKKKTHLRRSDGMFSSGGGGGRAASVWGNVGLNGSISSSGSSLENRKTKTIISPARFTGSQSRNPLPSALFGSTPNRPLISPASSRPSSPPGWGLGGGGGGGGSVINGGLDSFGGNNFLADDALSTVSAPSRFAVPGGGGGALGGVIGGGGLGGLFSTFSPLNSQATTPRGSDNTSTSDRLDWPPVSQAAATNVGVGVHGPVSGNQRSLGVPRNGGGISGGVCDNNAGGNVIDDTFTDDSDSEESRCLADATMKNVDRATKAKTNNRRGRRRGGGGGMVAGEEGGHFMKVVAVVSVVANVVLAFYLGTMMKS